MSELYACPSRTTHLCMSLHHTMSPAKASCVGMSTVCTEVSDKAATCPALETSVVGVRITAHQPPVACSG